MLASITQEILNSRQAQGCGLLGFGWWTCRCLSGHRFRHRTSIVHFELCTHDYFLVLCHMAVMRTYKWVLLWQNEKRLMSTVVIQYLKWSHHPVLLILPVLLRLLRLRLLLLLFVLLVALVLVLLFILVLLFLEMSRLNFVHCLVKVRCWVKISCEK